MKRLRANDSADPRVKVGHRQATLSTQTPLQLPSSGGFWLSEAIDEAGKIAGAE